MSASFPGAVKTFATRSAGQTIDASHVNDLQDEVNAIEDGLVNGSAPLNSSRITAPALSVSGGSTLTTLAVTGASSFAGDVVVSGTLTARVACPTVKVNNGSTLNLGSTAWVGLNWDNDVLDGSSMHSTASNSSRITFVASTGVYTVGCTVPFSTQAVAGMRHVRIMLNDASNLAGQMVGETDHAVQITVVADAYITSTADYVTVLVKNLASTGSVLANSTLSACAFWAHRVSVS